MKLHTDIEGLCGALNKKVEKNILFFKNTTKLHIKTINISSGEKESLRKQKEKMVWKLNVLLNT